MSVLWRTCCWLLLLIVVLALLVQNEVRPRLPGSSTLLPTSKLLDGNPDRHDLPKFVLVPKPISPRGMITRPGERALEWK